MCCKAVYTVVKQSRYLFKSKNLVLFKEPCLWHHNQFITLNQNTQDVMILSKYIGSVHAPYFLKSLLAITAVRSGKDLWFDLAEDRKCFHLTTYQGRMIKAIQESLMSNFRYMSDELVIFTLFDDNVDKGKHCAITSQMRLFPNHSNFELGKTGVSSWSDGSKSKTGFFCWSIKQGDIHQAWC